MLTAAPYMATALPIMVPLESWFQIIYYRLGCYVYDLVAGKNHVGIPRSMFLSKEQSLYSFPMLNPNRLKGSIVYYDGQMNDTRYGLAIALTAIQSGAVASNYIKVKELVYNEKTKNIEGAKVCDEITGEIFVIKSKSVINATGPFTDEIREMAHNVVNDKEKEILKNKIKNENTKLIEDKLNKIDNINEIKNELEEVDVFENIVVPAAGVHIVLPDHFSPLQMGLIVPETKDGRVLFFLRKFLKLIYIYIIFY